MQLQLAGALGDNRAMTGGLKDQASRVSGQGDGREQAMNIGYSQAFNGVGSGAESMQAGYQNMGWNSQAGFNPMMQNMQNPLAGGQWNMFPGMMGQFILIRFGYLNELHANLYNPKAGMPGMSMDPMAMSQGVFGGFGGQAMGMNGMNSMSMNMGMGMGTDAGQGGYGGWNGQAVWNTGQDKFNPMTGGGNTGNGMNGDFGVNITGYGHHHHPATAAAGYNLQSTHGNYSQMPLNQQYHQNHDFQETAFLPRGPRVGRGGRGFGHNRGGRAGGNHGQGYMGDNEPFHQQFSPQLQQTMTGINHASQRSGVDESGPILDEPTDAKSVAGGDPQTNDVNAISESSGGAKLSRDEKSGENADGATAAPDADAAVSLGGKPDDSTELTKNGREDGKVNADNQADQKSIEQSNLKVQLGSATVDTRVINAPLGPAALVQGDQPHNDFHTTRGRGFPLRGVPRGPSLRGNSGRGSISYWPNANGVTPPSGPAAIVNKVNKTEFPGVVPVEPKGKGVVGAPKAPKALREGLPNTGIRGRGGMPTTWRGGSITGGTVGAGHGAVSKAKRFVHIIPSIFLEIFTA